MRKWYVGIAGTLAVAAAWWEPTCSVRGWLVGEPFFAGRSVSYWQRSLVSEDPDGSDRAFRALAEGGRTATDVLCELVQRTTAPAQVRWNAAEILGKSGEESEKVSGALLRALEDPDLHVRTVAAESVAKVNTDAARAVPALTQLLESDAAVPVIRALSVYREHARPALEKLLVIMQDRSLPSEVRWNAVRTVGKMGAAGVDAVPVLIRLMKDDEPTVREHAAEAVGDIGPPARDAIPALVQTLNDSYFKARRDAVRSLGQVGPEARSAVAAIEPLLADPEALVRDAARNTIETLTGSRPPEKPPESKPGG